MFELIRANKRRSIALIAGFVLVVAVVVSLLPALRAARIMPKDALGAF